jgi:hypothetical protein
MSNYSITGKAYENESADFNSPSKNQDEIGKTCETQREEWNT